MIHNGISNPKGLETPTPCPLVQLQRKNDTLWGSHFHENIPRFSSLINSSSRLLISLTSYHISSFSNAFYWCYTPWFPSLFSSRPTQKEILWTILMMSPMNFRKSKTAFLWAELWKPSFNFQSFWDISWCHEMCSFLFNFAYKLVALVTVTSRRIWCCCSCWKTL